MALTYPYEVAGIFRANSETAFTIPSFGNVSAVISATGLQGCDDFVGGWLEGLGIADGDLAKPVPALAPNGAIDPPFPPVWPYNTGDVYGREYTALTLNMFRADTYAFQIQVILGGSPVNITGGFLRFTAKWAYGDPDVNAVIVKTSPSGGITINNPVTGLATITIGSADTATLPLHSEPLYYDVLYTDAVGAPHTVLNGVLNVKVHTSLTFP